jgi:hypothetical protein
VDRFDPAQALRLAAARRGTLPTAWASFVVGRVLRLAAVAECIGEVGAATWETFCGGALEYQRSNEHGRWYKVGA